MKKLCILILMSSLILTPFSVFAQEKTIEVVDAEKEIVEVTKPQKRTYRKVVLLKRKEKLEEELAEINEILSHFEKPVAE